MPPGLSTRAILSTRALQDLLREPFGPFQEDEVLSGAVRNTTVKNPLCLHNVRLIWNNLTTGLTECERWGPGEIRDNRSHLPQRFLGTLDIQSLSWLTAEAVDAIEKALRKRDYRARSAHTQHPSPSILTLQALYGENIGFQGKQFRVKVEIVGYKNMGVKYLDSDDVPYGLMMNSVWNDNNAKRYRRYEIKSMHIFTYDLSRTYLSCYRLYHILSTILKLDADSNTTAANRTPLEQRTPDWYIDLYIKHLAYRGSQRQHRYPCSSSDEDIQRGTDGTMIAGCEHTLRHVSRAEVRSKIAEHAEWLIQITQEKRFDKLFDVDVWKGWLHKVRRWRREAASAGRHFGTYQGSTGLPVPIEDVMEVDDLPLIHPFNKPTSKSSKQKRPRSEHKHDPTSHASSSSKLIILPDSVSDEEGSDDDMTDIHPAMQRDYDSDFSPPSSADELSSDSDDLTPRPAEPPDPAAIALIPLEWLRPPQPTPGTMKWFCCVKSCHHVIDLLNLTEEDLDTERVSPREKKWLRERRWHVKDIWFREAFGCIVDQHQVKHLKEWGVELVQLSGTWTVRWRDSFRHGQSHHLRVVRRDNRRDNHIKEEEN